MSVHAGRTWFTPAAKETLASPSSESITQVLLLHTLPADPLHATLQQACGRAWNGSLRQETAQIWTFSQPTAFPIN